MLLHSQILGQGTPFLILHGFLGMSDNWKTLGNRFAEEGYDYHIVSNHEEDKLLEDLKERSDYLNKYLNM